MNSEPVTTAFRYIGLIVLVYGIAGIPIAIATTINGEYTSTGLVLLVAVLCICAGYAVWRMYSSITVEELIEV